MLNIIKKLFMKTPKEDKGILAKDMSLADLKSLAVSMKILSAEEVAKMKKADILKAVGAWEKKEIAKNRVGGKRVLGGAKPESTPEVEDLYEGKKVLSRTPREINGKMYEDVRLVTGETFTNPINQ